VFSRALFRSPVPAAVVPASVAAPPAPPAADRGAALPYGGRVLLTLAGAIVVFVGIWFARGILAPAAIAAVVVIIAAPVRGPLERRGWPRWLATTAVITVSWLILAFLAALLLIAVSQFASMLPSYFPQFTAALGDLLVWIESLGIAAPSLNEIVGYLDPATIATFASDIVGGVAGLAAAAFFIFAYAIFMAADASRFAHRSSPFETPRAAAIGRRYFTGVRRYYVVNATFGAIVAVLDGIVLAIVGIPVPVVWAILAFVTNFIPNIGFVIGLIPPVVFAFLVGGWPLALVVTAVYCVINVVLQVLVQPKFVSDAVGLGLTLTFFSVVFWTLVIGPVGSILSIPLTLLLRAVLLEPDPQARAMRRLWGDPEADEPHSGSVSARAAVESASSAGSADDAPRPDRDGG
ncbi:AI-2E family transporter, partial [Agromyces seonyuensis]